MSLLGWGAAFFTRPLGWLLHSLLRRGWRVSVSQSHPASAWVRPPRWGTGKLENQSTALAELDRLARLVQAGTWPPH